MAALLLEKGGSFPANRSICSMRPSRRLRDANVLVIPAKKQVSARLRFYP